MNKDFLRDLTDKKCDIDAENQFNGECVIKEEE